MGVVHHRNYFVYAEEARIAFHEAIGLDRDDLTRQGVAFQIGEASARYRTSLRWPDEFDVKVRVGEVRRSTWTIEYQLTRADGTPCAEMSTTLVQVSLERHRGTPNVVSLRNVLLAAGGREVAPRQ